MNKPTKIVIVGVATMAMAILGFMWFKSYAYEEIQPIAFSHQAHVVKNNIDCSYCHEHYTKYAVAGLPSIQTCYTCHSAVQTDKAEVKKIFSYWERREEIPWVRLYKMPDHVVFTHKRHIQAGVTCNVCHGQIGMSTRSRTEVTHTMGSCIQCHKANAASVDCWTCHK